MDAQEHLLESLAKTRPTEVRFEEIFFSNLLAHPFKTQDILRFTPPARRPLGGDLRTEVCAPGDGGACRAPAAGEGASHCPGIPRGREEPDAPGQSSGQRVWSLNGSGGPFGRPEGRLSLRPSDRSRWGDGVSAHSRSEVELSAGYWAVIPAYNETATIRDVASRVLRQIQHVIVVDDGSTDGTAEALEGLPVILLRNPTNCGKATSLWRGFQHAVGAGAAGVVTLDGDGQHAPEDIPRLVAEAVSHPDRLIIGARRPAQRRAAFWRYSANRVADFGISWAAGCALADSQSGFRVYPASLLSRVTIQPGKARSFVFESEILIEAMRSGHRSLAVPIEALRHPGARPSYFRPVLDIARITCMVGGKLLSRGLFPIGLYRSLSERTSRRSRS